jgi:CNT family concentrative nucleoside transporter
MMGLAWLMSSRRRDIPWRTIGIGLALQFALAVIILRTPFGQSLFDRLGDVFLGLMNFVDVGAEFVFGMTAADGSRDLRLLSAFAFGTLATIIFFSSLMSVLYHLGLMQKMVWLAAVVMRRAMNLSGAESLSVAANIFLGQVEAPLVVRPYLATMTRSELMSVMVAGFATIAGGVMAAYVRMGIDAGHLVTASVVSAPAAIIVSKILLPETEEPLTRGQATTAVEIETVNLIDAAAQGAVVGLNLALQIAAIIIAFLALIAMCEFLVTWAFSQLGSDLTLRGLLGYAFAPLAWMMGIPAADCRVAGELLGLRLISNEFIAYAELSPMIGPESPLTERTQVLLTYALCGFANFGSIGVQIGGIGAAAPSRQTDLARLGLRAMLGGMLACFMTACVAGVLL